MPTNRLKTLILLIFFTTISIMSTRSQTFDLQSFSIKVSPGALAYYGDMSTNDLNVFTRIATGSKFGFGASVIKQFTPFFSMQAQFTAGSLYTSAPDQTYFAGSLNEYSLSARFDPLKLLKRNFGLSPYVSIGIGTFGFRSVRREIGTNLVLLPDFGYGPDGVTNLRRQTAMSMPIAIGLSYKVLPYLQLELEHSLRFTNTDLLDCFKGPSTANDLFSLTSIGLRFSLPSSGTPYTRRNKNENRLPLERNVNNKEQGESATGVANIYVDLVLPETVLAGQLLEVKLRLNKGTYQGMAKLVQKYPEGFSEVRDLTKSTLFSFSGQNVVIEWGKMPSDGTLNYNYQVKVGSGLEGSQTITGRLDYEDQEGHKTVYFNKTIFVDQPKLAETIQVTGQNQDAGENRGNIRKSQPLTGIEFRVQCGAFRENSQAQSELAAKYRITEVIQEESIDGWYKYTVGSFRTYDEAASYRDKFITRTGITTAFLVAYKDGKRLPKITDAFR